jgi:subfamily B ATP-binding cassette protein MsbA
MKRPPRSDVIIEDIDTLEHRRIRERGRKKYSLRDLFRPASEQEPQLFRRLASFALPYRMAILGALCLSGIAALARIAHVFVIERMFQPVLSPSGALGTLGSAMEHVLGFAPVAASAGHWTDPVLIPLRTGFAQVASGWHSMDARQQLGLAALTFLGLVFVEQVNKYAQRITMRAVSLNVVSDIRMALFRRMLSFSMRFYHANHSGRLMSRLTGDLNGLGAMLVDVTVDIATDFFALVLALGYLYYRGGWMVLGGLAVALLSFVPVQHISRRLRRKDLSNQSRMSNLFINLSEVFSAQKIVKAFNAEPYEVQRFEAANDAFISGSMKSAALRARVQPIVEIIGSVGVAVLMWFGGLQVLGGTWEPEGFIAILFLLVHSISAMRRLGDTNTKLHSGLSSADRVATVLYSQPELVDAPDTKPLGAFREGIRLRGVSYDHDPRHPVLRDISLELPRGKTLALVGPTGSGKTTLAELVPRFFDPDEGVVEIDGTDIRRYTIDSVRRLVAIVTQDPVLFRDTIAANIAYGRPDTPREAVVAAAKAAHAHDFIMRLPKGYETSVGERGLTLSGGERQRVSIARALIKDAPILILDEATSALDSASEAVVQQAIANLKAGRTTIVIAHRLSTVRDADLIVVLERGRIAQRGSHAELMRSGGLYADMVKIQQGA